MSVVDEMLEQLHSDTERALDNLTIEELEYEPQCDCHWDDTGKCSNAAAFLAKCRHCPLMEFCCDPCRVRHYREFARMNGPIECRVCHWPALTVDQLLEFTPLVSRS